MDPTDSEIRKRLDKLKEDRPPVPSEEELHSRLQKLKGEKSSALNNKYVLLPCVKSNEEQVNDLMKQYSAEATLQRRLVSPVSDIEERLKNLKTYQFSSSRNDRPKLTDTEQSSRSKKKSVLQMLAETVGNMTTDEDENMECSSSHSQEYFCYICDRVPKWICYTCDDQLFCPGCYKEYHEDEDEPHKKRLFNVRRKRSNSDSD